jgi:predicted transcriptional regulator
VNKLLTKNKKNTSNNHRGYFDLIADILETSQNGVKKTWLMYHCNLSFKQLKSYMDFLLRKELLHMINENTNQSLLKTTDKGKQFLNTYSRLKSLMEQSP